MAVNRMRISKKQQGISETGTGGNNNFRLLKKVIKYTLAFLSAICCIFIIANYPFSSSPKELPPLSDTVNIRKNLEAIINTPGYRNFQNIDVLNSVSQFIYSAFQKYSDSVAFQNFEVDGKQYRNVIASFGPENADRIIVGAHYDVCQNQDGADDNASGTAGVLELARLLAKNNLKYRVDLVAFTLEEPPYFRTENMGSYVHAQFLSANKIPVKGMVSLEMIGYFSNEKNSQDYPVGFLKWFYGSTGDYITIVQKFGGGKFAREFKRNYFKNNSVTAKSFNAPSFVAGIDLSDHRNYWKFGFSAAMVTNTAFYRNRNYHTNGDTLQRLNLEKMGKVIDGVYRALLEMK